MTDRLEVSTRVLKPADVQIEMTISMDLSDWERLVVQLKQSNCASHWPAYALIQKIDGLVRRMNQVVRPSDERLSTE